MAKLVLNGVTYEGDNITLKKGIIIIDGVTKPISLDGALTEKVKMSLGEITMETASQNDNEGESDEK